MGTRQIGFNIKEIVKIIKKKHVYTELLCAIEMQRVAANLFFSGP